MFEWRELNKIDEIVIYGYTEFGKEIEKGIRMHSNVNIVYFDTKSEECCYEDVYRIEDYDWNKLLKRKFIIASYRFAGCMEKELLRRGVSAEDIIIPSEILRYQNTNILKKRMPRKDLRFVVCIVEHCNLNCARCDHFSPISEEWFMNVDIYQQDMRRMSELFAEDVSLIDIEGGEPLLHENVEMFLEIARRYFPNTEIKLFTNGLLLSKMNNSFWNVCRENNIVIRVTKYPIEVDYEGMRKLVTDNDIKFEFANNEYEDKEMIQQSLDLQKGQDKYESFHNCYMANGECAELREGKLYQCNVVANLHIFNRFFKQNLEVCKKDYLDIYEDISKEDIYDYLCAPIPACRYCKTKEWKEGNKWTISNRNIEEWT
ncbi:MAG: 4Fe-4S cluster-binding domain-containing protein [Lachnospiraceae bacterium]|nr:4Fe-4S cluster-binding domain-containing protein [Lachnospiraceae bacterium]